MINSPLRFLLRIASVVGVVLAKSAAQTASPPVVANEAPVELSPFVTTADRDDGYRAKETLAGMRIRTDLKDTGAAIDVLTAQFLDDIGAVNMNQALSFVANMEYADFPGGSATDPTNNAQYFNSGYVSRGITGTTVTTDFFVTGQVQIDRYNTDNLTFLKGPNAILFGIGSPSGIVGASSKRASLGRNLNSIRFMADTFGSTRTELDFSRVLIKNRLALRFDAVASDQHTAQKPTLERRNAVFATITFKPFSRTTITVNGEAGINQKLYYLNTLVADGYTPWVLAGRPTVNFLTGKGMIGGAAVKGRFSTAIGSGLQNLTTGTYLTSVAGSNLPVMDWRNMARSVSWSETVPSGNPGSGLINSTDRSLMANIPFTRSNAIVDLRANVWGGYNPIDITYSKRSIFIEQNLARNLNLELAWNQFNNAYLFDHLGNGGPTIWADPNELLPNGAPNPNVGKPYLDTGNNAATKVRGKRIYYTKRAMLSYELPLDRYKIWRGLGVGNYLFAAMTQKYRSTDKLVTSMFLNTTPLPGSSIADRNNRISYRYYLEPGKGEFVWDGFQAFQQASVPGAPVDGSINMQERGVAAPRYNQFNTTSEVACVQGSWWQAAEGYYRLVGLFGARKDTEADRREAFSALPDGTYFPFANFDQIDRYGTWGAMSRYTARTKSYNMIFRPVSSLRLFYNYSDIFNAAAGTAGDIFLRPLRPARGRTKEYGLKLDPWGDRLYLTATRFETGVYDATIGNSLVFPPVNDIYNAIGRIDLTVTGANSYQSNVTKGYEYGVTAAPTRDWRMRLAFGNQKTIIQSAFDDWVQYFALSEPLWQSFANTPLVNPSSGGATVAYSIGLAKSRLRDARAIIGQSPTNQRRNNISYNTNYTIPSGLLKSVRLGAGFQWASRNIIGYARDANGNLDVTKPYRGAEKFSTNASAGYTMKLYRDKVKWDIQINLYNLLGADPLLAFQAVDDGTGRPLVVRRYLQSPFQAQLTNTFSF